MLLAMVPEAGNQAVGLAEADRDEAVVAIEEALDALAHAATRVRTHERLVEEAGVQVDRADVAVLRHVTGTPPPRLGELAERLGVDAPSVTRKVQQLEARGLVVRASDPVDRRAVRVVLTRRGRRVLERLLVVRRRQLAAVLVRWPVGDQLEFARLLRRFAEDLLGAAPPVGHEELGR